MSTQICSIEYNPGNVPGLKYFKASKTLYTSQNAGDTGITPVEGANATLTPLLDTGELMRVGFLDRINVYCKSGANKRITYRMFCTPDKRNSLLAKFNGDSPGTLNGKEVLGASSGVRRAVYKV